MESIPNGHFVDGLVWYDLPRGDALLSKGFRIELGDLAGASVEVLNSFHSAMANLLFGLPDGFTLQSQWRVTSDYRDSLEPYHAETLAKAGNRWTRFVREELYYRLTEQMERGQLRREEHVLWFSRHVRTALSKVFTHEKAVRNHIDMLIERESQAFANLHRTLQQGFGSFARVVAMDDEDHFLNYRNFLNPSLLHQTKDKALAEFDPEASIQELVFRGDGVPIHAEEASFHFAGNYHALFTISRWPQRVRPLDMLTLTRLPFNDFVITTNLLPKNTRAEIAKEEKMIERLEGDMRAESRRSLLTAKMRKEKKVDELAGGYTRLFSALQVVRVWDRSLEGLVSKAEAIKAAISDMGAQYYHATRAASARSLFFQTWPGWTRSKYRGFDLEASNHALAALLPFSSTFTGHLDKAEALFHGSGRNVVGVRTFSGSTPQHMLVIGGTGAGKSVFMNALMSQTEQAFHRTIIIEEGFSYATYTQTLGASPIVLQLDGELTLNYLDTGGLPLSHYHIGSAAALCLKMVGASDSEDTNKRRLGQLGEYINRLYADAASDWMMANEAEIPGIQRFGYALDRYRIERMPNGATFLDTYLAFQELRRGDAPAADEYETAFDESEIVRWASSREGERLCRDLIFSRWKHEDYENLTHHSLYMALRYGVMAHHDRAEINFLADMLGTWTREIGQRGKFFDGVSNIDLDRPVLHFELSLIPENARDFKEAAGFLLNNTVRHLIMTDPRSWKKRIVFEEAPRFFGVPGGEEIVASSYATYRKYATWLVTVCQQMQQIPEKIRPVLFGNSQTKIIFRQKSSADLALIASELKIPPVTVEAIRTYPSPEHLPPHDRFSSCTYWAEDADRATNGTIRVYASPEMLYCSSSDGDLYEERSKALRQYADVTEGILEETASKRRQQLAESAS
jgi:hypothetical protein